MNISLVKSYVGKEEGYDTTKYMLSDENLGFIFFFVWGVVLFLGVYPRHMGVSRLGVELELELPAYSTAIAMPDPSCVCNLHHSSWQRQILNPLSKPRDETCVLMDTSQISFQDQTRTPKPGL